MDAKTERDLRERIEDLEQDVAVLRQVLRQALGDHHAVGGDAWRAILLDALDRTPDLRAATRKRFQTIAAYEGDVSQ